MSQPHGSRRLQPTKNLSDQPGSGIPAANPDTTLAERIKALIREQGITVVSILTAIGMTISMLVLALFGGSAPLPHGFPAQPGKGGIREWVRKQLQVLGVLLAKLAEKAAAAIPCVIGSVVSWLLSTAGKAIGWLAEHTWALLIAIGDLLLVASPGWLAKHKSKGN